MIFNSPFRPSIPNKDLVSWIFDDVAYDQDRPIYIDAAHPHRTISCREARTIVRKLACGFHKAGLRTGDCVSLHSFNDIYYSMIFLGVIAAGGVFSGTNPSYTSAELHHHIQTCNTKFIITEVEMIDRIITAANTSRIPLERIWIFDDTASERKIASGFKSWTQLLQHGESDWVRFDDEKLSKSTPAALYHSSGTTGLPKSAIITHYNLIAQHTLVYEVVKKDYEVRRIIAIPQFHVGVGPVSHTTALRAGQQTFVLRRFELDSFLKVIESHQITDTPLVPPIIVSIIKSGEKAKQSLKSVRDASSGAAPLAKSTQNEFGKLLPPTARITQLWGMTELSCIGSFFYWPQKDSTGSVGNLLPYLEVKLIDEEGKPVTGYNVQGELYIRGPSVFAGYLGNSAANLEAFDPEGYFKTGDIGYCDSKTKLWYIVDRRKDLIKVRGFQVAPAELEAVLLSHPEIADAAVVGVELGADKVELPRAFVVRRSPVLTTLDVYNYVGERLAKYKRLDGGVFFVDMIPKNPSGKILKRVLKNQVLDSKL